MSRLLALWQRLMRPDKAPPDLHRWCHATAEAYRQRCDWEQKVDAAMADNDLARTDRPHAPQLTARHSRP